MRKAAPEITPREAAKTFIRPYVLRGDSEESLRLSHMGSWNTEYRASIGGTIFHGQEAVRSFSTTHIGVSSVNDTPCVAVFPLSAIYQEVKREADPTLARQASLFSMPAPDAHLETEDDERIGDIGA